jgi:pyruvate/2-oxoglutarate dehydrogenase complex dihydrolipoamide acyltransferase (E2) component
VADLPGLAEVKEQARRDRALDRHQREEPGGEEQVPDPGLAKSIADLAGRARSKKLSPDEVTGGTFTITNPGIYGGLVGAPIINQPQVAILGLGAIEKRPVVIDDAIAIRPRAYISLSFDHRLIDGSVAEEFMGSLRDSLASITAAAI